MLHQIDGLLVTLREEYVQAMVAGSGRAADRVLERALDAQMTPGDIYMELFQPAAYEIGRLWQHNQVTVAQEHLATAIIERQMGDMHGMFQPVTPRPHTIVIGCVPDEWHRVGARMVADFFEADGWTVHYLGASVPIEAMVEMARDTHADMIGLSAEMIFNLPRVAEFVRVLEARGLGGIPVLVGGRPFIGHDHLHRSLNVAGSAPSARAALRKADEVLQRGAASKAGPATADEALEALRSARTLIIKRAVEHVLAFEGDPNAEALIAAGFVFTTRMLEAALAASSPELLDEQIAWANTRQPHDGVAPDQVLRRFGIYAQMARDTLPETCAVVVAPYLNRLITRQAAVVSEKKVTE